MNDSAGHKPNLPPIKPQLPPVKAQLPAAKAPLPQRRKWVPPAAPELKKGEIVNGKYEIRGLLGKGGFGEVYLAYSRTTKELCALKTFRGELSYYEGAREAFKKEALLWINLDRHPHIVSAQWVDFASGRLFVQMEYVPRDAVGRVTLFDHLAQSREPIYIVQTLVWGVQFCLGMEHAHSRGVKYHRDIKPANILIAAEDALKISDFGLASAAGGAWSRRGGGEFAAAGGGGFGMSMMHTGGKARCGTIGYMAPEVYRAEGAGVRSDLYSFGLVLWQMAAGSKSPPFFVTGCETAEDCMNKTYLQQMTAQFPPVDESLMPVIQRCLRPDPRDRYATFAGLRADLEPLLKLKGGKVIEIKETENTAAFWVSKGGSLAGLGRYQEAVVCCDKAIALDPRMALAWNNKGVALKELKKLKEAIACYDKALEIEPRLAMALYNKGSALFAFGWRKESVVCFDQDLEINPRDRKTWLQKGRALDSMLGRRSEAIGCYDKALEIDPRYALAWFNKGITHAGLKRNGEAIQSFRKFIELAPPQEKALIATARRNIDILLKRG